MTKYAVINNNKVENVVESPEAKVVGFFYPDADAIVEINDQTGDASIDFEYRLGKFVPFSPYTSWVFNEDEWRWEPPIPRPDVPENHYGQWNEESGKWDILEIPADPQVATPTE